MGRFFSVDSEKRLEDIPLLEEQAADIQQEVHMMRGELRYTQKRSEQERDKTSIEPA